jgi:hypothetical protein
MSLCGDCHAGCCRSFAVPITGADILRVENQRGLTFWEFVCRWADPEGKIALNHAPHFYFSDEPEMPFVICLMHEASRMFPGTTKCQFLRESLPSDDLPLGRGHCGVYEHRPAACRAFPTKLNENRDLAIIYDVPARGRPGTHPIYQLCPRPWEPADVDPVQVVQDLVVAKYEMDFFRLLADTWNRNVGMWSLFPDFLRIVYASRVQSKTSSVAEQPALTAEQTGTPNRTAAAARAA